MSTPEDASLDVGARARALLEGADWDRLARVFASEATSRERAAIAAWVAADPSRGAAVEALRQAWLDAGTRDPRWAAWSPEAGWHALAPRLAADATPSSRGLGSASPRVWPRGEGGGEAGRLRKGRVGQKPAPMWLAVVGVIAVGTGLAVGSLRDRASVASRGREYATVAGQQLSVTLVDGTQLTLAPASKARIAIDYGQGSAGREVDLEGEAYFAVAHDAAHPFAVRAHGAVARDVGTAFDVRAYPEDAGTRIAVADGVVAVVGAACSGPPSVPSALHPTRPAAPEALLPAPYSSTSRDGPCGTEVRAGDVATVGDGRVAVEHGVDVANLTAWRAGTLVFKDVPLREVAADLSRWYGLDVRVTDPRIAGGGLSGVYTADQPLDEVVSLIAHASGATYRRDGQSIVIAADSSAR